MYLDNRKKQRMSDARIKKFILEILLGIEYLHSKNIIHRDLKPSNIFLKGKEYTVQIGDFGESTKTSSGTMIQEDVGSIMFQAPEMLSNNYHDFKADIWSLGCIIFNLCHFDFPFSDTN